MDNQAASTEIDLVEVARAEARYAKQCWRLVGFHTPSRVGRPPHESADVCATLGRLRMHLTERTAQQVRSAGPVQPREFNLVNFSIEHDLNWTELDAWPPEGSIRRPWQVPTQIVELACASANVLTLNPQDKVSNQANPGLDSHRRTDLATRFQAASLMAVGLQETRLRVPRA